MTYDLIRASSTAVVDHLAGSVQLLVSDMYIPLNQASEAAGFPTTATWDSMTPTYTTSLTTSAKKRKRDEDLNHGQVDKLHWSVPESILSSVTMAPS